MLIYLGLFLTAFATLALEITLVRLLSVTTWYHLAFYAISTSMLGMTAGATTVFLRPEQFRPERSSEVLAKQCFYFAISVPLTLMVLCMVPMGNFLNFMMLPCILATTLACGIPFYFAGIIVTAILTKTHLPIGRLYASDLAGASLGCLFVLAGFEFLDAPSLILLCGGVAAISGLCFAWRSGANRLVRAGALLAIALTAAAGLNSTTTRGIRPLIVKGALIQPAEKYSFEKWNSFSRIAAFRKKPSEPQLWGPSPKLPPQLTEQCYMNIDGEAGTTVRKFSSKEDIEHLRYDVTNLAYNLRNGDACIIGVGGGRDIQSALLFGCKHVVGVEINPIFVGLLKNEFRDFAGLADREDVEIEIAEARSYLAHTDRKFSILQMSLIDTWAATGAGAFSLSENTLYTVEGWMTFLNALQDDGIFTVSRWHSPDDLGETSRVVALATAALFKMGVDKPADHIALVSIDKIATLIVGRSVLTPSDIDKIRQVAGDMQFDIVFLPGQLPQGPLLRSIVSSNSLDEIEAASANSVLNCSPTTDENPYFFNMLRLKNLGWVAKQKEGVIRGNLNATLTLAALMATLAILAVATIIVPLVLKSRSGEGVSASSSTLLSAAIYFSLIGAGFMLTEIGLVQRLTVLLSHPMYALGILLFTLIASTGIGSFLSDRLPLTKAPWVFLYPLVTSAVILLASFVLNRYMTQLIPTSLGTRIATSVAFIFPIGLLLGMFFPAGMRLARAVSDAETPWYWALNGIFGVLCSAVAVFISINFGISINFYIAAACYALITFAVMGLRPGLLGFRD